MKETFFTTTAVSLVIAVVFSLHAIARKTKKPELSLSWILAFFLLPIIGPIIYALVGFRNIRRRKRILLYPELSSPLEAPALPDSRLESINRLGFALTGFSAVSGNKVEVYEHAAETYEALQQAIEQAQHFVHLEYYIFQANQTGQRFKDLLIERVRAGISCRVIVDHVGSFFLSPRFVRELKKAGVEFHFFWPANLMRPWGYHLRNHRKIAIIDNRIGFIGGQNLGGEPMQLLRLRKRQRRDTQLKIEGPAVLDLQSIFSEDWFFASGEKISVPQELQPPVSTSLGSTWVQVLPSGPDERESLMEILLTSLFHSAEKRITITTPYLIPTLPVLLALEAANARGISVEIMVPKHSDHFWVDAVRRSWYPLLLHSGLTVLEFDGPFLHSKVVTIDDDIALIGSANMDERSFRINFECSVLVYATDTTAALHKTFDSMKSSAEEIVVFPTQPSWRKDLQLGALRMLSPLL